MSYKRLEIYVGWTCNQRCTYCMEFPNMEEAWNKKVSKYDILKKLIKYKQKGYNHVTLLGGEPFIQEVFLDALKISKKLGYTVLVTTNCTTLHIESQAKKFLPYIDELILSVEAIGEKEQQVISRTQNFVHWDGVFSNIASYWRGHFLKANIVVTQDNKDELKNLVQFVHQNGIKNISITYPDLAYDYYGKKHILEKVAPKYSECVEQILPLIPFCKENSIHLKLPDFPFCVFPKENISEYIQLTDDFDYETRIKINHDEEADDRGDLSDHRMLPRKRNHYDICDGCKYTNTCWGPSKYYNQLYGLEEIHPITQ